MKCILEMIKYKTDTTPHQRISGGFQGQVLQIENGPVWWKLLKLCVCIGGGWSYHFPICGQTFRVCYFQKCSIKVLSLFFFLFFCDLQADEN